MVRTIFHRGPETYELLLVCSGVGSICGALIIAAMEKVKGQARIALLTLFILGAATAAFAFSRWLPLSCVLIFLCGAAVMASASLMLSVVQLIVVDSMRGRVMSVYNLAFRAGIPLGALTTRETDAVPWGLSCAFRFRVRPCGRGRRLPGGYEERANIPPTGGDQGVSPAGTRIA